MKMSFVSGCALLGVVLVVGNVSGVKAASPWSNYRFAPSALQEIDLASVTDWKLSIDGGAERPIKVPGGGWNSDQQDPQIPTMSGVKDYVVYTRPIRIPAEATGNVVKVLFGGCNYGAEVFVDDRKLAEHHAPMTPFEADLTGAVEPGKLHLLKVKAYHRRHYYPTPDATGPCDLPVGFDFPADSKQWNTWTGNTKFAYGIMGHVRLAIYPPIHIADVFVRPSVSQDRLEARVWVRNATAQDKSVKVNGSLAAWNGREWKYPALPTVEVPVSANSVKELTVGPVKWALGAESYWWPNIPFREDYAATLHWLNLTVAADGKVTHECRQRFGFVEHAEGPFYYTVNGVRYTSFGDSNSYGQVGEYDCWTETPCFQPPHGQFKGCPEMWRRYQRIGFNSMRLSTSVPTRYMLETADEAGFMLNPEGGVWGNGLSRFHPEHTPRQLREMVHVCRNHPCVARYSVTNEVSEPCDASWPWRPLIDTAVEEDGLRPLVVENCGVGRIDGLRQGHARRMNHYASIDKGDDQIHGMGECAWAPDGTPKDGLPVYGIAALQLRLSDWAHFAPWSWLNYWPNFLEGMNHQRHPWKANNNADRRNNEDGWNSPIVTFVQRTLHPYLVLDLGVFAGNGKPPRQLGRSQIQWPSELPTVISSKPIERSVEVFNGGLFGNKLLLVWSARWDKPDGAVAVEGSDIPCEIEPGFHATKKIHFTVPASGQANRKLYLVLELRKAGRTMFRDDGIYLNVITR